MSYIFRLNNIVSVQNKQIRNRIQQRQRMRYDMIKKVQNDQNNLLKFE